MKKERTKGSAIFKVKGLPSSWSVDQQEQMWRVVKNQLKWAMSGGEKNAPLIKYWLKKSNKLIFQEAVQQLALNSDRKRWKELMSHPWGKTAFHPSHCSEKRFLELMQWNQDFESLQWMCEQYAGGFGDPDHLKAKLLMVSLKFGVSEFVGVLVEKGAIEAFHQMEADGFKALDDDNDDFWSRYKASLPCLINQFRVSWDKLDLILPKLDLNKKDQKNKTILDYALNDQNDVLIKKVVPLMDMQQWSLDNPDAHLLFKTSPRMINSCCFSAIQDFLNVESTNEKGRTLILEVVGYLSRGNTLKSEMLIPLLRVAKTDVCDWMGEDLLMIALKNAAWDQPLTDLVPGFNVTRRNVLGESALSLLMSLPESNRTNLESSALVALLAEMKRQGLSEVQIEALKKPLLVDAPYKLSLMEQEKCLSKDHYEKFKWAWQYHLDEALFDASCKGIDDRAQVLLKEGANPLRAIMHYGRPMTSLGVSVYLESDHILQQFMAQGVDIHLTNLAAFKTKEGVSLIQYAAFAHSRACIETLLPQLCPLFCVRETIHGVEKSVPHPQLRKRSNTDLYRREALKEYTESLEGDQYLAFEKQKKLLEEVLWAAIAYASERHLPQDQQRAGVHWQQLVEYLMPWYEALWPINKEGETAFSAVIKNAKGDEAMIRLVLPWYEQVLRHHLSLTEEQVQLQTPLLSTLQNSKTCFGQVVLSHPDYAQLAHLEIKAIQPHQECFAHGIARPTQLDKVWMSTVLSQSDMQRKNIKGEDPLRKAVMTGASKALLKQIMSYCELDVIRAVNMRGETALHDALRFKNETAISLLLPYCDVHHKDVWGHTILVWCHVTQIESHLTEAVSQFVKIQRERETLMKCLGLSEGVMLDANVSESCVIGSKSNIVSRSTRRM